MKFVKVMAYVEGYEKKPKELLVNLETVTQAKAGILNMDDGGRHCVYAQTIRGDLPTIDCTLAEFEAKIAEACK